jgi:amidophosphoribosyltransferase
MPAHERSTCEFPRLSLDGVYEAIGSSRATHCDACFTGDYPLEGTEQANGKHALEELALAR